MSDRLYRLALASEFLAENAQCLRLSAVRAREDVLSLVAEIRSAVCADCYHEEHLGDGMCIHVDEHGTMCHCTSRRRPADQPTSAVPLSVPPTSSASTTDTAPGGGR